MESNRQMNRHHCQCCGLCCLEVGRTFWKNGLINVDVVRRWPPEVLNRARNNDHEDGSLPCEMLSKQGRRYVCLLESRYGRGAKPLSCRQYPFYGEKCFREEAELAANGVE